MKTWSFTDTCSFLITDDGSTTVCGLLGVCFPAWMGPSPCHPVPGLAGGAPEDPPQARGLAVRGCLADPVVGGGYTSGFLAGESLLSDGSRAPQFTWAWVMVKCVLGADLMWLPSSSFPGKSSLVIVAPLHFTVGLVARGTKWGASACQSLNSMFFYLAHGKWISFIYCFACGRFVNVMIKHIFVSLLFARPCSCTDCEAGRAVMLGSPGAYALQGGTDPAWCFRLHGACLY